MLRLHHEHPGNLSTAEARDTQQSLRSRVEKRRVPFVLAHANDWIGYAVTPEAYDRGGYEPCLSFHGPDLGPWLIDRAIDTLGRLEASQ